MEFNAHNVLHLNSYRSWAQSCDFLFYFIPNRNTINTILKVKKVKLQHKFSPMLGSRFTSGRFRFDYEHLFCVFSGFLHCCFCIHIYHISFCLLHHPLHTLPQEFLHGPQYHFWHNTLCNNPGLKLTGYFSL